MALIKRDRENFWMLNWLDEYMTGHKGFICGGCFKNIFNKEKVKDLDISLRIKVILMMRYSILTARHRDMTETM